MPRRRRPWVEWDPMTGKAHERRYEFVECPKRSERMYEHDIHGRIAWTCDECGGHGGHQNKTIVTFIRRPEFDAPQPPEWSA